MYSDRKLFLYIGLVTFTKGEDLLNILSDDVEGAVSWVGGKANSKEGFAHIVADDLNNIGLVFEEIEDIEVMDSIESIAEFDEHLAYNLEHMEPGKVTAWGTLHVYVGEGEA